MHLGRFLGRAARVVVAVIRGGMEPPRVRLPDAPDDLPPFPLPPDGAPHPTPEIIGGPLGDGPREL